MDPGTPDGSVLGRLALGAPQHPDRVSADGGAVPCTLPTSSAAVPPSRDDQLHPVRRPPGRFRDMRVSPVIARTCPPLRR